MDQNFSASLLFTLKEEGGFSNDPHDPGGATYKGITLAEFRNFFAVPNATVTDLKNISDSQVSHIYYTDYWLNTYGNQMWMPDGVDLSVFDMGVNAGPVESLKLMQMALGTVPDGIVGPRTKSALAVIDPQTLIRRLYSQHNTFYHSLANFHYFGQGWINRSAARLNAALGLLPNPMPQGKAIP